MRLPLFWKLFLVLTLSAGLVVGALSLAVRLNVSHEFSKYLEGREAVEFQMLATGLSAEYHESAGWQQFADQRGRWRAFLRAYNPSVWERPERHRGEHENRREHRELASGPRITLLDQTGRRVAGPPPEPEARRFPLMVAGETVGWLSISHTERRYRLENERFLRRHFRTLGLVGGSMVVMAVVLALGLSWYLLRPVRKLASATQEIANRRFETRVEIQSQDEFGQLAADFNRMAEQLESFEQQRQQWITDVSHELGTPLAVLQGEIEALQDGLREPTPERMASLHAEVLRLDRIVKDLRLINRVEAGNLELNRVSVGLGELLHETTRRFRERFAESGLAIREQIPEDLPTVFVDPNRLQQVLDNLLENAVCYVEAPGTVQVRVEAQQDGVLLSVEDTGPGIPAAALPHLFDRFYRVEQSRSRESGGSGLGLAICKQLIEAHGGRITAKPAQPQGLCIEIHLPKENQT